MAIAYECDLCKSLFKETEHIEKEIVVKRINWYDRGYTIKFTVINDAGLHSDFCESCLKSILKGETVNAE